MKGCMRAMVAQLKSDSEDLQQVSSPVRPSGLGCPTRAPSLTQTSSQVIASVLRNLSWRADVNSKKTLREVGSVRALTGCALEVQKVSLGSGSSHRGSHGPALSPVPSASRSPL